MKHIPVSFVIAAVALCAAGFFGGMKFEDYQISKTRGTVMRQFANGANGVRTGGRMGGRQVAGDVVGVDDKTMTVKMPDGSSKIVIISDSTSFNKAETGTKSDVQVGSKVAVFGTDNTDGSVTAQNIQLNPLVRGAPVSPKP